MCVNKGEKECGEVFSLKHSLEKSPEVSKHFSMNSKREQMPTSYANPAFDVDPAVVSNSGGPSPMGSNIFIVKPEAQQINRIHPQPHRHEPVTRFNLGRSIFRGIRCK